MSRLMVLCCGVLCWFAVRGAAQITAANSSQFPLVKGTVWIYRLQTREQGAQGRAVEKTGTLRMEIKATIQREHVTAAVVSGFPLNPGEFGEKIPTETLLVRVGSCQLYCLVGDSIPAALKRLHNPKDDLIDLVGQGVLLLDLPLAPGKVFGELDQLTRQDGFNNTHRWLWIVNAVKPFTTRVKGVTPSSSLLEFELGYRTNPDQQRLCFVPGVGITTYAYLHHGAILDWSCTLLEYHPVRPSPPPTSGAVTGT